MLSSLSLTLMVGFSTALFPLSPPLSRGILILIVALIVSFLVSSRFSSWFGILIFLIYVGGLLVMFAYFSSIGPNQQLEFSKVFAFIVIGRLYFSLFSPSLLPLSCPPLLSSPIILFLISWPNVIVFLGLASVLFLALVIVAKITSSAEGPLRPFQYV